MGVLFIVAGVVAILSVVVLTSNPAALPWVVVSSLITVFAGYRVWRTAHPTMDFRQELVRRGRATIGFIGGVALVLIVVTFPQLLAIAVGIWVLVMVVLFAALAWGTRKGSS